MLGVPESIEAGDTSKTSIRKASTRGKKKTSSQREKSKDPWEPVTIKSFYKGAQIVDPLKKKE
jgi:hypothetical protein